MDASGAGAARSVPAGRHEGRDRPAADDAGRHGQCADGAGAAIVPSGEDRTRQTAPRQAIGPARPGWSAAGVAPPQGCNSAVAASATSRTPMFVTLVHCHVKPEHVEAFADACRANHEGSVREEGNIRFDVLRAADDPTRFILYECAPGRVVEAVTTGFDVTLQVPVRVRLLRVAPQEHVLVVVVHHISGDGFSMAPLTRDVMTAYAARAAGHEPRGGRRWRCSTPITRCGSVRYSATRRIRSRWLPSRSRIWRQSLAGLPDQLDLPTDRPRPAEQSLRGDRVEFDIDADLHRELRRARAARNCDAVHGGARGVRGAAGAAVGHR